MNGIKTVFNKEIREMLRDKRVLQATIVMPVFIIALFVFLMGFVSSQVSKPQTQPIGLVGMDAETFTSLADSESDFELIEFTSQDSGREALDEKDVRLLVVYPEDFLAKRGTPEATVNVFFDSDDPLSALSLRTVASVVEEQNKAYLKETLQINDLPESLAIPVPLETTDIKEATGMGGSPLVSLLPYLIVLWAFYGGMSIVSDLVAGEKERGTMETLLISPIGRGEVALGKMLALLAVCFVSSITTLVGVTLLGMLNLEVTKDLFPTGLSISPLDLGVTVVILVLLCAMFSCLMTAISAYARNIRESQTYLSLLSFVILLPAIFSQFIGFTGAEKAPWVAWTPILNTAMAIRNALKGETDALIMIGSVTTNLALAIVLALVAVRLFRKEEILLRV